LHRPWARHRCFLALPVRSTACRRRGSSNTIRQVRPVGGCCCMLTGCWKRACCVAA